MVETVKTRAALLAEMADDGNNTAEEVRNGIVSMWTPEWMRYLDHRLPDETAHDDDDFFNDEDDTDWTQVVVSGTSTWDEAGDVYHVFSDGQTLSDINVAGKALTLPSAPMTLEVAVDTLQRQNFTTITVGLGFTDGLVAASNVAWASWISSDGIGGIGGARLSERAGTLTAATTDVNNPVFDIGRSLNRLAYLRIVWTAANTFALSFSIDGKHWSDYGAGTFSKTMTPTHVVLISSTNGDADEFAAAYHYLRVYDSDLSV